MRASAATSAYRDCIYSIASPASQAVQETRLTPRQDFTAASLMRGAAARFSSDGAVMQPLQLTMTRHSFEASEKRGRPQSHQRPQFLQRCRDLNLVAPDWP